MAISKTHLVIFATLAFSLFNGELSYSQVLTPDAVAAPSEATVSDVPTVAGLDETAGEETSIWSKMSMPKMSVPKVTFPKLSVPSWPKNEDGIAKSPFTPISNSVSSGMKAISSGTKKAWAGTKNMFSFGGDSTETKTSTVATTTTKRSLWDRLKGEEPEPDGPRTVAEWMSQPRPKH